MQSAPYIGTKIEELCAHKNITLRSLCQAADLKYQTLHAQIANKRHIPFETVQRISVVTDTSLDWFTTSDSPSLLTTRDVTPLSDAIFDQLVQTTKLRHAKDEKKLDAHSLTLIYFRSGGLISALEPFIEQVDLYCAPQAMDSRLKVYRMGKESLASKTLQRTDPEQLQKSLDAAPEQLKFRFLTDYRRAATGEFIYSIETLNAFAADHKERIRLDYLRLLIRFESEEDGPLIVNLSELLR